MSPRGRAARTGIGESTSTSASTEGDAWYVELLADLSRRASYERAGVVVAHRSTLANITQLQSRLTADSAPDLGNLLTALLAL